MSGLTRWSPFEDVFSFQREVDRLFNQFWSDMPSRTAAGWSPEFQVSSDEEAWHVDLPLPGIAPENVALEVAGNTLRIRAEQPGDDRRGAVRYEQAITAPAFLDLDRIAATHRHGMLRLTLPLKDGVKPRRIQIETGADAKKQLTSAA